MLLPVILLLLAVGMVIAVAIQSKVRTHPTREQHMVAMNLTPASSYEQTTNHLPATPVDMGPIAGTETPFRVNAYNAYM
jgi:flagellar basal body-associated protein FliL